MIPHPWVALVLALGACRVTRLVGWDDLPPIVRVRAWVTGQRWQTTSASVNAGMGLTNEPTERVAVYRRPLLAHFIACPYCQGFWVCVLVYVAWLLAPTETVYGLAPFALSTFVGTWARMLDP